MNAGTTTRSLALVAALAACKTAAPDRPQPSPAAQPAPQSTPAAPAAQDGWRPLYTGRFDDFKIYLVGQGYLADPAAQDVFLARPDHIHVRKGTNGLIVTKKPYSRYHVRVQYRWGDPGGSKNAGLMVHTDLESTVTKDNRPRSIEINMRADAPGSIWLARNLGPFGSSSVAPGTKNYLPPERGGQPQVFNPFAGREFMAHYEDGKLPTRPDGEWNTMEAIVKGSESVEVIVNGKTVSRLHDIRLPEPGTQNPGAPNVEGGIGLQSEGQEVFYRAFEIRDL